jgi:hypothetical protein
LPAATSLRGAVRARRRGAHLRRRRSHGALRPPRRVTRVLEGAILGSMFFEPSTRTRVSFGSAFNLLGGEVRETTGFENSAIAKGESLYDTARVLSGYSDVIAMRHPGGGLRGRVRRRQPRAGDQRRRRQQRAPQPGPPGPVHDPQRTGGRGGAVSTACASPWSAICASAARCTACASCCASSTACSVTLVSPGELRMPAGHRRGAARGRARGDRRAIPWRRASPTWTSSTARACRRSASPRRRRRPVPRALPPQPAGLHAPLRSEHGDHAPAAAGLPGAGAGARRRPQRQSQPRDLPPDRQRRAGAHGAVCADPRRGRSRWIATPATCPGTPAAASRELPPALRPRRRARAGRRARVRRLLRDPTPHPAAPQPSAAAGASR